MLSVVDVDTISAVLMAEPLLIGQRVVGGALEFTMSVLLALVHPVRLLQSIIENYVSV